MATRNGTRAYDLVNSCSAASTCTSVDYTLVKGNGNAAD
jgi:hypothetical protein